MAAGTTSRPRPWRGRNVPEIMAAMEDMDLDGQEHNPDVLLAVLRTQVEDLREWRAGFLTELNARLTTLGTKMDLVVAGRPTWAASIIITLLTAACSGMAVYIFGRR